MTCVETYLICYSVCSIEPALHPSRSRLRLSVERRKAMEQADKRRYKARMRAKSPQPGKRHYGNDGYVTDEYPPTDDMDEDRRFPPEYNMTSPRPWSLPKQPPLGRLRNGASGVNDESGRTYPKTPGHKKGDDSNTEGDSDDDELPMADLLSSYPGALFSRRSSESSDSDSELPDLYASKRHLHSSNASQHKNSSPRRTKSKDSTLQTRQSSRLDNPSDDDLQHSDDNAGRDPRFLNRKTLEFVPVKPTGRKIAARRVLGTPLRNVYNATVTDASDTSPSAKALSPDYGGPDDFGTGDPFNDFASQEGVNAGSDSLIRQVDRSNGDIPIGDIPPPTDVAPDAQFVLRNGKDTQSTAKTPEIRHSGSDDNLNTDEDGETPAFRPFPRAKSQGRTLHQSTVIRQARLSSPAKQSVSVQVEIPRTNNSSNGAYSPRLWQGSSGGRGTHDRGGTQSPAMTPARPGLNRPSNFAGPRGGIITLPRTPLVRRNTRSTPSPDTMKRMPPLPAFDKEKSRSQSSGVLADIEDADGIDRDDEVMPESQSIRFIDTQTPEIAPTPVNICSPPPSTPPGVLHPNSDSQSRSPSSPAVSGSAEADTGGTYEPSPELEELPPPTLKRHKRTQAHTTPPNALRSVPQSRKKITEIVSDPEGSDNEATSNLRTALRNVEALTSSLKRMHNHTPSLPQRSSPVTPTRGSARVRRRVLSSSNTPRGATNSTPQTVIRSQPRASMALAIHIVSDTEEDVERQSASYSDRTPQPPQSSVTSVSRQQHAQGMVGRKTSRTGSSGSCASEGIEINSDDDDYDIDDAGDLPIFVKEEHAPGTSARPMSVE